jgi:hypothetical protein
LIVEGFGRLDRAADEPVTQIIGTGPSKSIAPREIETRLRPEKSAPPPQQSLHHRHDHGETERRRRLPAEAVAGAFVPFENQIILIGQP